MFKQMYYTAGPFLTNGWHERTEFGVHMYGSMTDKDKAHMTVFVDNSKFSPGAGPSYHSWCDRWVSLYKLWIHSN